MWRHREIKLFLPSLAGIGLAGTVTASLFPEAAALITAVTALLLIAAFLLFTAWRYRELRKLSAYVRQISSGDFGLDLRDNREGELSILKNDIYKVTLKLSEQGSALREEKTKLAEAMADISHQLKTPLTSLMVLTDLLSDPNLAGDKRAEFTKRCSLQLQRIDWLVSSLLKLAKIDAGTVMFKQEPVSVARLIGKAVEPLLIPLDIKNQTLVLQEDASVFFTGDLNWSAEALTNILKNCVEHTPAGGRIEIQFSENPIYTEIILQDNGPGIPRTDLPYIFQRFYKGRNAGPDSVGIGLNLAHSIITAQNGTIDVQSKEGAGTRFTIKFYRPVS